MKLSDAEETEMLAMLRTLKQIVAEAGDDYVYQKKELAEFSGSGLMCAYVYNGEPDCLAGRVLARLGVPLEDLTKWENATCFQMSYLHSLTERPQIPFNDSTLDVLSQAQTHQDGGGRWGAARDIALNYAAQTYGVVVS